MSASVLQLPLGPLQTNCYILTCTDTKDAIVIDPSWDGAKILATVNAQGWRLAGIFLTHAHFDHVGGLAELVTASNAPVGAHPDAWPMLKQAPASGALWGIHIDPVPVPDVSLEDGQQITVGNLQGQVLFTPGHAPGHVCFYFPSEHLLFSGDALFQGSIGRTDLPGGDLDLLLSGIRRHLLVLPDETVVLSGHGPATTIGDERRMNPFLDEEGWLAL